ncbi:hypothetical protein J437_LFUL014719 [Ladona fulva]|uniref:Uncharacterized protein n=1 Tax=Ladona fulva TaxID=123851 RepID=A0A8K0P3V4_LADFU|nr:hypothetical protein J437_LFUL014719 [Ladona fulva]
MKHFAFPAGSESGTQLDPVDGRVDGEQGRGVSDATDREIGETAKESGLPSLLLTRLRGVESARSQTSTTRVATKHILEEKVEAVKEYGERRLSFVRTMSLDRQGAALLAQNCKELASSGMEMAKDVAHRFMTPKESEEEIEEVFFFSFFFAAWVQQSPRRRRHSPHRILTPEKLRQSLQPCSTMAIMNSQRHPMLCGTNFDFLHLSIALPPMLTIFLSPFRRRLPSPPPMKIRELELIEELEE